MPDRPTVRSRASADRRGARELSGEQRTEHAENPDVSAPAEPSAGRGWLWHGFAALGISALGLVVAGAVGLTTKAQTSDGELSALPETSTVVAPIEKAADQRSARKIETFPAFTRGETPTDRPARTAALRDAIVKEQAAQRDELLAKTADEVSRAAELASGDARQKELTAVDRASREAGARIAAENLRRAIAARMAAASRRQAVERGSTDQGGSSSKSDQASGDGGPESSGTGSDSGGTGSGSGSGGGGGGSTAGGVSPVPGAVIGAHFGEYGSWSRYHTGIDFRAAYGTPIRAVKSGVVLYAGNSGDWAGNHVAIKHGDGKTTMSSHMSSMDVRAGQTVQAGQVIGRVGETGRAFGAHLHFELYPEGVKYGDVYKAINPQPWLKANGVTTH
jgi:murein DD-endopeptidase MepM/ murein hydrolase activator NlpD